MKKEIELSVIEKRMMTRARNAVTLYLSKTVPLYDGHFVSEEELEEFCGENNIANIKIPKIGKKTVKFLLRRYPTPEENLIGELFPGEPSIEVQNMNEKEYNEAEGIRRSDLWVMNDSPEKFRFRMDNPEETTAPALVFGAAAHKLVLEPDGFYDEYAVAPQVDRRTKDGKAAWEQFASENAGKTIISQDDFDTISSMKEVLEKNTLASIILFGDGYTEIPFFWTDPETGEKCKAKFDRLIKDDDGRYIVVDYKTAQYAQTDNFNRSVIMHGYHVQAAMYTEGVKIAQRLKKRPRFIFVAQEKKPPYSVNVIEVSYDVMNFGSTVYHDLLSKYHDCKELDVWPGYTGLDGQINQTSLPRWAMNEMEEE